MTKNLRAPLLAIVLLNCSAFAEQPTADITPHSEEVVSMPEFEVKATAYCNFGFGIKIFGNVEAGTINRIYIDKVVPGSEAEKMGLRDGDEILSLNGRKVSDLKGGIKGGSELFHLLINRPPGEKLNAEIEVRVVKHLVLTAGTLR